MQSSEEIQEKSPDTGREARPSGTVYHTGIDIGSISVNIVLLDENSELVYEKYHYCSGRPFVALRDGITELLSSFPGALSGQLAYTGTGGETAAQLTGGSFVNEIIAQSTAAATLYPDAHTIIEMGGEDSKLIFMEDGSGRGASRLSDFEMNALCAAGTGSFLDQQANRIGVRIEEEFGELALQSTAPPRIAGRCSVFAKSDMIHLQQIATPLSDIVAGLCYAVDRNLRSTLGRGKKITPPVLFCGGVAANKGMVRAFRDILNLDGDQLIIPPHHASMGALGAIYHTLNNGSGGANFRGLEALSQHIRGRVGRDVSLEPLIPSEAAIIKDVSPARGGEQRLKVSLGLDVGSLSTNIVLIDSDNRVVARRYLPTAGKPLEAIKRGIREIYAESGDKVEVVAAGTTGSGRYLTGDFIGADAIRNEITAQATAAIAHDRSVDTIFEIGGQDSKYIRIENGVVVDFEMNKVCAAGTGSFLEEQAEKLGINIEGEFGDMALAAGSPARLGDRCTVFMESDLNSLSQKGESVGNLVGGLAYSIVHNYLNRVVGNKPVGNKIFFQGGVANNRAVVAAFEKITGKKITIPPHFDVTGAIGAAIMAREATGEKGKTAFRGFETGNKEYSSDSFVCKRCNNNCEIRRITIEGEAKPLFYGGRCDHYDVKERKGRGKGIPNLFTERETMMLGDYREPVKSGRPVIGIPKGLTVYYQQFPFWRAFFEEAGFDVMVSSDTTKSLINRSLETMVAETCFPVEVMHGHMADLAERGADYLFAPFIVNMEADKDNPTANCNCPWIQSYSTLLKAAFDGTPEIADRIVSPVIHFRYKKLAERELKDFMRKSFGIDSSTTLRGLKSARRAQADFEAVVRERGSEVMRTLPTGRQAVVILGRSYNSGDPALNLNLVKKLINAGVLPIPSDYLPLSDIDISADYPNLYWPNGRKIVAGAMITARNDNLFAIFTGNFRCGPDSFLQHFVHSQMKGKPYLHIEVDEHSADAGMITRIEAFLDSLRGYRSNQGAGQAIKRERVGSESSKIPATGKTPAGRRTLWFPYMNDGAYSAAAACRACGLDAAVLPMQTATELELARRVTTGTECFPMICTTGSFIRKLLEPGIDPARISFFMPDHNGPCRFGKYNRLQRQIFEQMGFPEVEIVSPKNDNSYADMPLDKPVRFRMLAWKGFVATDMMRKLLQESRPYEKVPGDANRVYRHFLEEIEKSVESGARKLPAILKEAAAGFDAIADHNAQRKPVVAVAGEIFMRDNHYCSARLVERLEKMGAETMIMPLSEWMTYSTYRYKRDSRRKGNRKGLARAFIQQWSQDYLASRVVSLVRKRPGDNGHIPIGEILDACEPYISRHYDGDPPLSLGNMAILSKGNLAGVANILPFTCMPGTIISAVSEIFRRDHGGIPWINIAYDGQEDTGLESRLQAFMHQVNRYHEQKRAPLRKQKGTLFKV